MKIDGPSPFLTASPQHRQAKTPEAAAQQFEEVLVRQFVRTMTDGLFDSKLTGESGPSWMGAYGDMQQDALVDNLTKHLVDGGALRIRELLLRQWQRTGEMPADAAQDAPNGLPAAGDPSLHQG